SIAVLAAGWLGSRVHAPVAHAAQTWNVQVGDDAGPVGAGGSGTYSLNFYYPNVLTITVGDTVSWNFPSAEPHGVTFDNGHTPPLYTQLGPGPNPGEFDFSAPEFPVG